MTSPTYTSWYCMRDRCDNPDNKRYDDYGGRGISYPEEWKSFEVFRREMGCRLRGTSLDRIDNEKGYSKNNCRWATQKVQANNRSVVRRNRSGITGVHWDKGAKVWRARAQENALYSGPNFFLACCARKSWEALYKNPLISPAAGTESLATPLPASTVTKD